MTHHVSPEDPRPCVLLCDGRWYPVLPAPENVNLPIILGTLTEIRRYNGQISVSVGQHTLALCYALKALGRDAAVPHALLHDAPEAFLGDLTGPVKRADPDLHAAFKRLDAKVLDAIYAACKLDPPDAMTASIVARADSRCCAVEARYWYSADADTRLFAYHGGPPEGGDLRPDNGFGPALVAAYRELPHDQHAVCLALLAIADYTLPFVPR